MAGGNSTTPKHSRHPELVSGPISRFARSERGQTKSHCQIRPVRIVLIDQIDLPLPMPALQLLLAQDRRFHCAAQFEVNERVNGVLRSETGERVVAMLPNPAQQIRRNPDVNRAVGLAGHNVDAGLALLPHEPECAARWVLKQVQDDEEEEKKVSIDHSTPSCTVTLNLFQGPFLGSGRSIVGQQGRAVRSLSAATGLAARWTLKQVQGDGELGLVS